MAELLVDTDVLIDHLRLASPVARPGDALSYSVLSRAELFAGRRVNEEGLRVLLASMRELGVSPDAAESAGRIRRETQIALPDALIAATALVAGLPLLTRNRRHFERVEGLALRSPG